MKIVADENIPFVKDCFSSIGEVLTVGGRAITPAVVRDADVLLVRSITLVDEALLAKSAVQFVATATIGMEHVDQEYLASAGVGFASAPGSNSNSVAEYVVAALLALGRKHRVDLAGRRIGVVGVGNVGSKVVKKAQALGMTCVLNDPPLARQTGDAKYRPLEEVYGCDFVTMHTPLTRDGADRTYHLADEVFFGSLKDGCFFINTSRGAVADTAALKRAIAGGRLGGAVLDVWENEPNIDGELIRKVDLSTPHIAGYSFDGKVLGLIMIYRAVCEHFGLEARHDVGDFLPAPPVPVIHIERLAADEQAVIHDVVQQVYVINRDDFNTREILLVPQEERGRFFDDLRKNYPVRREFQNTTVLGADAGGALGRKLAGIGFKVG